MVGIALEVTQRLQQLVLSSVGTSGLLPLSSAKMAMLYPVMAAHQPARKRQDSLLTLSQMPLEITQQPPRFVATERMLQGKLVTMGTPMVLGARLIALEKQTAIRAVEGTSLPL